MPTPLTWQLSPSRDDVAICAGQFCPAQPGEPGARIIHPSDFGLTD